MHMRIVEISGDSQTCQLSYDSLKLYTIKHGYQATTKAHLLVLDVTVTDGSDDVDLPNVSETCFFNLNRHGLCDASSHLVLVFCLFVYWFD